MVLTVYKVQEVILCGLLEGLCVHLFHNLFSNYFLNNNCVSGSALRGRNIEGE